MTTYTTYGDVRGQCGHAHATLEGAYLCLEADRIGCRRQGGGSDRHVCAVDADGYLTDLDGYTVWPAHGRGCGAVPFLAGPD